MTIVELLAQRDGLDGSEAREIAQDIYTRVVVDGEPLPDVLAEYGIDLRELGIEPHGLVVNW